MSGEAELMRRALAGEIIPIAYVRRPMTPEDESRSCCRDKAVDQFLGKGKR